MHLSDEQISQFQKLYYERFGTRISKDEALEQGTALVRLVKMVASDEGEQSGVMDGNDV